MLLVPTCFKSPTCVCIYIYMIICIYIYIYSWCGCLFSFAAICWSYPSIEQAMVTVSILHQSVPTHSSVHWHQGTSLDTEVTFACGIERLGIHLLVSSEDAVDGFPLWLASFTHQNTHVSYVNCNSCNTA